MKTIIQYLIAIQLCICSMQISAQSNNNNGWKAALERSQSINENFKLTNPSDVTDISKPFKVSGYGVPGATVEINITPISTGGDDGVVFITKGQPDTYKPQNFTVTIDGNGSWTLPSEVKVSFRKNASQRRVQVMAAQYKGGRKMKNPVVKEIKLDKRSNSFLKKGHIQSKGILV